MSRRPRRNHSPAFKAKVALEALADGKTVADIATKYDVHPNQVTDWRKQLKERAAGVFGAGAAANDEPAIDVKALHAKIGQLTLENDFLEGGPPLAVVPRLRSTLCHLGSHWVAQTL